ncbi:MAG TPA: thioredoxin domain-containing protein [Nitrospira sp.]|nr:thioredoxin domain-containing protein [Nitrospira sp.]
MREAQEEGASVEPQSIGRPLNRLNAESSPYLRQHAANPVDWFPWGEEAFARAKAEDKPILLSIGYSACHWCHVMAHESFECEDIAALMNRDFINVKVDREERPDLDDIYQKSVQVFTGRGGGWPLTMFLTPDREPFYGGTYFPPASRYNLPGFPDVLRGVIEAYRHHRDEVTRNVERVKTGLLRVGTPRRSDEPLTEQLLEQAGGELGGLFDDVHGGFGDGPKFPTVPPLNFMLRPSACPGDESLRRKVLFQLRRMAAGGIYDHLGGGFHRYSVDGQWMVPHFEKMLYDNAQLVRLYLDGWRLTKEERFRHVVEDTLEYVRRELTHQDGAFFAAQDADSEGREGAFFVWDQAELTAILGADLGGEFCRAYGVTESGNFDGKNVLHRLGGLEASADEAEQADLLLRPARAKVLAVRNRRSRPARDENILTGWNAMMVCAFLDAYQAFGATTYLTAAERALTFLLDYAYAEGRVYRTVTAGQARLNGYLDDAAWLATALLDAFEATSHRWYLEQAREIAQAVFKRFWDDTAGGCFFTSHDHEALLQRMMAGTDSALPSGNAVFASFLLRLFSFTGEEGYYERARRIVTLFHRTMTHNPYGASAMLCAGDWLLSQPKEVVVIGARGNPLTEALLTTVHQRYLSNRVVLAVDPSRQPDESPLPLAAGKTGLRGNPAAYVCHGRTCSAPVTEPKDLERLLLS